MNTCMSHDEMIFDYRKLRSKVDEDAIPSVVVLNFNFIPEREEIGSLIEYWLSRGAVHFALTGREFGEIEDEVDWVIVDNDDLNVVTTSHENETPTEILEFVLKFMRTKYDVFKLVVVSDVDDGSTGVWKELIGERESISESTSPTGPPKTMT